MPPYTDKAGSRTIHAIQPVSQILARARSPQPLKATTRDTYISSHHALKCGAIASYHRRVLLTKVVKPAVNPKTFLKPTSALSLSVWAKLRHSVSLTNHGVLEGYEQPALDSTFTYERVLAVSANINSSESRPQRLTVADSGRVVPDGASISLSSLVVY